ncbi:MAG: hypothetical protein ACK58T_44160, partial [Phycisphaerae bacterium]
KQEIAGQAGGVLRTQTSCEIDLNARNETLKNSSAGETPDSWVVLSGLTRKCHPWWGCEKNPDLY